MHSELIVAMREASREIGELVTKLSENSVEGSHAALPPGELQALCRKLAQVAKRLDLVSPSQPKDQALQAAINDYVDNLETLRGLLITVQDTLGKRRDRLKKDFERLNSARAWAESFRATH